MIEYGINKTGAGLQVFEPVTLGFPSREYIGKTGFPGVTLGKDAMPQVGYYYLLRRYYRGSVPDRAQCHNPGKNTDGEPCFRSDRGYY